MAAQKPTPSRNTSKVKTDCRQSYLTNGQPAAPQVLHPDRRSFRSRRLRDLYQTSKAVLPPQIPSQRRHRTLRSRRVDGQRGGVSTYRLSSQSPTTCLICGCSGFSRRIKTEADRRATTTVASLRFRFRVAVTLWGRVDTG